MTHVTYLDTIGRPALIFRYKDLTDKHVQSIYACIFGLVLLY